MVQSVQYTVGSKDITITSTFILHHSGFVTMQDYCLEKVYEHTILRFGNEGNSLISRIKIVFIQLYKLN
jgi:hypothetical protein